MTNCDLLIWIASCRKSKSLTGSIIMVPAKLLLPASSILVAKQILPFKFWCQWLHLTICFKSFLSYYIWKWKIASLERNWKQSVIKSSIARSLVQKLLAGLTAEEMDLVKWGTQANVKDEDLSLRNICFHCYSHSLNWSHEYFVWYVIFGPNLFAYFL